MLVIKCKVIVDKTEDLLNMFAGHSLKVESVMLKQPWCPNRAEQSQFRADLINHSEQAFSSKL